MVNVDYIDKETKTVFYDDGSHVSFDEFKKSFINFFKGKIAGETLVPNDMEMFMRRTSGKNLSLLVKSKKMEGYMEGSMDKLLTRGQKIAIGTIATVCIIGIIIFMVAKSQGLIPGM